MQASGSTLQQLCGLSTVSVAELLVEVGDPRRFTIGGLARFNGTAPLVASTGEGPGEPIRHRYNPGGNRRINAVLHRMAITQLRFEPRAKRIYTQARGDGHTKKEARRILKRHLSDVIYRRMIRDLERATNQSTAEHPPPLSSLTALARGGSQDAAPHRTNDLDGHRARARPSASKRRGGPQASGDLLASPQIALHDVDRQPIGCSSTT